MQSARSATALGFGVLLAGVVSLAGCGNDGSEQGSGSSGSADGSSGSDADAGVGPGPAPSSASSGAPPAPLDVIDGIDIPASLTLCGALVPTVSDEDIRFDWTGAPPATTQYALRLGKTPSGASTATTLAERVQAETSLEVGERASGASYRLDVYALQDRTPLCTLGGTNSVAPP